MVDGLQQRVGAGRLRRRSRPVQPGSDDALTAPQSVPQVVGRLDGIGRAQPFPGRLAAQAFARPRDELSENAGRDAEARHVGRQHGREGFAAALAPAAVAAEEPRAADPSAVPVSDNLAVSPQPAVAVQPAGFAAMRAAHRFNLISVLIKVFCKYNIDRDILADIKCVCGGVGAMVLPCPLDIGVSCAFLKTIPPFYRGGAAGLNKREGFFWDTGGTFQASHIAKLRL